jgi:hypothetical protein
MHQIIWSGSLINVVRGPHVLYYTLLYFTYFGDLLVPNSYLFSSFMVNVIDRSARKLWKRHLLEERQGISAEMKWISRAMDGSSSIPILTEHRDH